MEKKMETTIVYWVILGLCRDNGKENGNYYSRGSRLRAFEGLGVLGFKVDGFEL